MGFSEEKINTIEEELVSLGTLSARARHGTKEHHIFNKYYNLPVSIVASAIDKAAPLVDTLCSKCFNFNFHAVSVILPCDQI
ncbi:hypothetical protein ACXEO8_24390 [Cytobacillus firmus]